jgi:hypothetical protein
MSNVDTTAPVAPVAAKQEINKAEIIANSPFAKGFPITRNGITAHLDIIVGTRKQWLGVPYPAFQLQATPGTGKIEHDHNLIAALNWIGADNVVNALNTYLRRVGQDALVDSTPESGDNKGVLNLVTLAEYWTKLEASGLKISELEELLEAEQKAYEVYISQVVMPKLFSADTSDAEKAEVKAKSEKIISTINSLRDQLEKRKRKPSKEAAVETVSAA